MTLEVELIGWPTKSEPPYVKTEVWQGNSEYEILGNVKNSLKSRGFPMNVNSWRVCKSPDTSPSGH